jgi:hypothetical protein
VKGKVTSDFDVKKAYEDKSRELEKLLEMKDAEEGE